MIMTVGVEYFVPPELFTQETFWSLVEANGITDLHGSRYWGYSTRFLHWKFESPDRFVGQSISCSENPVNLKSIILPGPEGPHWVQIGTATLPITNWWLAQRIRKELS